MSKLKQKKINIKNDNKIMKIIKQLIIKLI